MDTPIVDFLRSYQDGGMLRFHMPGHKGRGALGCEGWDITEVRGADSLYEAEGIIARSETNAASLFGSRRTFYSTEGSSQCIKAMLHLAVTCRPAGTAPVVLAARNVHKSFVHAAALIGFEVEWLWPEGENASLCACPVTPEGLERALAAMPVPPCAVYITSPDYLGNLQDIAGLADTAHRHGALLLADNAHGAYLRFLKEPMHPLELGADLCCDSAHKTLPVLTGGAYLHIGKTAPAGLESHAKQALALYGSTSPSYLTLASLDSCCAWLEGGGRGAIQTAAGRMDALKARLTAEGWRLLGQEPLKLTVDAASSGSSGRSLAALLRRCGIEPEYADPEAVVLMASGGTTEAEFDAVSAAFARMEPFPVPRPSVPQARGERVLSIREALFAPSETVSAVDALGRVCAAPTVACPPAIPIAVSGEVIGSAALELFRRYGVEQVEVVAE